MPISHGEGNYFAEAATVEALERDRRVVFRYATAGGDATAEANPNGSVNNIAGIINERGNVLGMMPHPERAGEELLGSVDGLVIFRSMIESAVQTVA
jgi:phosphoribosylformylglycinamidine synthase